MQEILDMVVAKGSVYLLQLIEIGALALMVFVGNWLKKKTDLEFLRLAIHEFEETARPHVKHWFEEVSKVHIAAAEDGKIDAAEKKALLQAAGKAARAEYEHLYKEVAEKLRKIMPNASDYIEKRMGEFYEEMKASFRAG